MSSLWSTRSPRVGAVAALVVLASGGLALIAAGPPTAPTPDTSFSDVLEVGWVLVPVVVREKGKTVRDLTARDFRLFVEGKPVKIRQFEESADAPWSLVILQDVSGSMGIEGKLDESRRALATFLDRALPGDELAVATFAGGETAVEVPFTEDLGAVRESLATWEAWGTTALHDAIAHLPQISLAGRHAKRAALLVTDGVDNASRITASEARALVQRAELAVYVLGFSSGDPFALAPDGSKVYRYADMLNLLASLSGGRYYPLAGREDLQRACAEVVEDLRAQYVLSFPTAATGRTSFRSIRVEVPGRPEARVVSRRGYLGSQPAH